MKHRISLATAIATVALLFSLGGVATAAWRQHRGPVLKPTLPWEGQTVQEPTVYWARGKYRMWYTGGWFGCSIGYATSPDGIHWRKRLQPIITNACHNNVVRTRHGWVAFFSEPNGANLYMASSRDGIHFQPRHIEVRAAPWAVSLANSFAWQTATGWDLLYEGITSNSSWQIAFARGHRFGHWHAARRPRSFGIRGLQWTAGGPWLDGRCLYFHAAYGPELPTDIYRRCIGRWSTPQLQLRRSQPWEYDQVADPTIAHAPGRVPLMFFDGMNNVRERGAIGVAQPNAAQ